MYLALRRYSRPTSIDACLSLLHDPQETSALLGGGTDLNAGDNHTLTHLVDTQALGLTGIEPQGDALRLGARVTLADLRSHPAMATPGLMALRQGATAFANRALQNQSTLGGRIALERSDQDIPPVLAAMKARLEIAQKNGASAQTRVIDFPLGASDRRVLDGALITHVILPALPIASALRRLGRSAVDIPIATCAAALFPNGLSLAANLQGPNASDLKRLTSTEQLAQGWHRGRPDDWREQARQSLLTELAPYSDPWAGGDYRQDLSATLAVRAMAVVFGEEEIP